MDIYFFFILFYIILHFALNSFDFKTYAYYNFYKDCDVMFGYNKKKINLQRKNLIIDQKIASLKNKYLEL